MWKAALMCPCMYARVQGKIVFLAPTKPLVHQQHAAAQAFMGSSKVPPWLLPTQHHPASIPPPDLSASLMSPACRPGAAAMPAAGDGGSMRRLNTG